MKSVSPLKTVIETNTADPRVILVTGGTGAGKTTHARALADALAAIRFSIDDWMTDLFWMDAPEGGDFDWVMTRIGRVEMRIRAVAEQVLTRGGSVILDLGFTKRDHRLAFAAWAQGLGFTPELHWVDVPTDVRWARVQSRNSERGETFAMEVSRDMFDFMEAAWEPPTDDEMLIERITSA